MKTISKHSPHLFLLCLALLLVIPTGFAQRNFQQDSLAVERMGDSAKNYWNTDTDKALQFATQALGVSQKGQYQLGMVKGYILLGTVYDRKSEFPKAISYYQQALDISKKENYTRETGVILYNMSTTYFNQSTYDRAFETGTASLAIKEVLSDTPGIAKCCRLIAEVYSHKNDFEKANVYIDKAIAFQRRLKSKLTLANMLNSAATINTGAEQYEKALKYLKEAETYIEEPGGETIALGIYNNFGICYTRMGKIDEAEHYYLLALQSEYLENKLQKIILTNNLGEIYIQKGQTGLAEKYLYQSLALANEVHSIEDLSNIHGNLADIYVSKKDYKKAYEQRQLEVLYSDSLYNEQNMKAIEELTIKFETKEMALKNKKLEQKVNEQEYSMLRNWFLLYGGLSLAAIVVLASLFYARKKRYQFRIQNMELEQKQYRAQMNPHFIFNCMNSIQHYIVHNDVKAANKFLSEFAMLMRRTIDINAGHFITVQEEMSYLDSYLLLEQMRFDGKFTYRINCDEDIDRKIITLPTMMLQPFVENAIQHGIRYLPDNSGVLTVSFQKENNSLVCMIDDNGVGRHAAGKVKAISGTAHVSQGISLIENKISVLNNIYKTNVCLHVVDKMTAGDKPAGTTVILKFALIWK